MLLVVTIKLTSVLCLCLCPVSVGSHYWFCSFCEFVCVLFYGFYVSNKKINTYIHTYIHIFQPFCIDDDRVSLGTRS